MKLILIHIAVFLFVFFSPGRNHAQKFYNIKSEKEFELHFISEVAKYNDTLSKTKQSGILFMKFLIKEGGEIDSIKFSIKQPAILISVLTGVLQQFKFGSPGELNKETKYVLPVFYDYVPELTLPVTAEKLLNQVPDINPDSLLSYLNFDFNGFFKVEESEKELWGIKCVLLPMVKISKPVVYQYNNKKDEKKSKQKPKHQFSY